MCSHMSVCDGTENAIIQLRKSWYVLLTLEFVAGLEEGKEEQ